MDGRQVARVGRWAVLLLGSVALVGCVTPRYSVRAPGYAPQAKASPSPNGRYKTGEPYQVGGIWYTPHEQPNYDQTGIASWYGDAFNMKATANGEIFDMNQFSAAHTTLPLPSMVEVTNLDNGRRLTVRVNDRGPFVDNRIIDLSHAAARELGYDRAGLAHVRVRYLGPAPLGGPDAGVRYAKASPPSSAVVIPASTRRPADEEIFDEADQTTAAAPKPLVAPPEPVSVSTLAPLPATLSSREVAALESTSATAQIYRIQAGAFSDEDNARRAVTQLAAAGAATIEPMERGGTRLYRVILPGPSDEAEAFAMRDRVAGIGFSDARVLRP